MWSEWCHGRKVTEPFSIELVQAFALFWVDPRQAVQFAPSFPPASRSSDSLLPILGMSAHQGRGVGDLGVVHSNVYLLLVVFCHRWGKF